MASLADDAAVERTVPGHYRADLSEDWSVWGPNGGYLAAVALRAAGDAAGGLLPVSLSCQFLAPARYGEAELTVERVHGTRRAAAFHVTLRQRNRTVLAAHVWTVADGLVGPERRWMPAPELPGPDELPALVDLMRRDGLPVLPIWERCYEVRLSGWPAGGWSPQRDGVPTVRGWLRLHEPLPADADPWLAAARLVFAVDVVQFPAIVQAFEQTTFMAPSMDLYVGFQAGGDAGEWLLVEGEAASANGGTLGARARVWSAGGHLLATGGQQMLYRMASPV
ncbi:thioesterase family protein [Micromonospora sp. WMMC241]|uniref:acyl-CoA thioesterase n=1 Tax=Micromonospora sp. WMMC241 TaxID=3015159 RepID=UPI0022B649E3|nr:thioesterase family protein [Micromonospora sp. WMMC241]MCZ7437587.1 thioesterase family protein [Micromonospora sp. WMMC241]